MSIKDDILAMAVQFTKAVESKQVAQQDAERARFVVLKADQVDLSKRVRLETHCSRQSRVVLLQLCLHHLRSSSSGCS